MATVATFFEYSNSFTPVNINTQPCGLPADSIRITHEGTQYVESSGAFSDAFTCFGVSVIQNIMFTIRAGDSLLYEVFTDASHTNLIDSVTIPVLPVNHYVTTDAPFANGLTPASTGDQTAAMTTPVQANACDEITFNAHHESRAYATVRSNTTTGATSGVFTIDGVPIDEPSMEFVENNNATVNPTGTITLANNASYVGYSPFKAVTGANTLVIEYTHNGHNFENDIFINIDNIGFRKIGDPTSDHYFIYNNGVDSAPQSAPSGNSTFRIELDANNYVLSVDGVVVQTTPRTVEYTSTIGVVTPSGVQPLGTPAMVKATNLGVGTLNAQMNNAPAQQLIEVSPAQMEIDNSTNPFADDVCQGGTYDLTGINFTNVPVGRTVGFYTDPALTVPYATPAAAGQGVYYATIEDGVGCQAGSIQITLTEVVCQNATAVSDFETTNINTPITINVLGNDTVNCPGVLTVVTSNPTDGTFAVNGDNTVTYTPSNNFLGQAVADYDVVCDGAVLDSAQIIVDVTGALLVNDVNVTPINTPVSASSPINDTIENNGTAVVFSIVGGTEQNGTITIDPNTGIYTATPATNYVGNNLTAQYEVFVNGIRQDFATITVEVIGAVTAPDTDVTNVNTPVTLNVATNDDIYCNGALTFAIVGGSEVNGTFVIDNAGEVTATPAANYVGNGLYAEYNVLCDGVIIGTNTITIEVIGAVTQPDTASTDINTSVNLNVSLNDDTYCNGALTYQIQAGSEQNGGFTIDNTGAVIATPTTDYVGGNLFAVYEVLCDGIIIGTDTITIDVVGALTNPDTSITNINTPVTLDVSLNDTIYCDGTLTFDIEAGSEQNGTFIIDNNGNVTATPSADYLGDSLIADYNVYCDGNLIGNDRITIEVIGALPQDDNETTGFNMPYSGTVVNNDLSYCNGTMTHNIVVGSEVGGTFTIDNAGNYVYTPSQDFIGLAQADYEIRCDGNVIGTATIFVEVTCDAPTDGVPNGEQLVFENQPYTYGITGYTGTPLIVIETTVTNGIVTGGQGTDEVEIEFVDNGVITWTLTNCGGTETFTVNYPVTMATGDAVDDSNSTPEGVAVTGQVPPNDVSSDLGTTTYALRSGVSNGTVTLDLAGEYVYTPNPGFIGQDSFTYYLQGDNNNLDWATVYIDVVCRPVDGGTIIGDELVFKGTDVPYTITGVTGTDAILYEAFAVNGTIISGQGTDTVIARLNANGSVGWRLHNCGDNNPFVVEMPVEIAVGDAVDDNFAVYEGDCYTGTVASNDIPSNLGTTTFSLKTPPENGTVTLNPDGTYEYCPCDGYLGVDFFEYYLRGDGNVMDWAAVNIEVTCQPITAINVVGDAFAIINEAANFSVEIVGGTNSLIEWSSPDGVVVGSNIGSEVCIAFKDTCQATVDVVISQCDQRFERQFQLCVSLPPYEVCPKPTKKKPCGCKGKKKDQDCPKCESKRLHKG